MLVQNSDRHAELALDSVANGLDSFPGIRVLVNEQQAAAGDLETVHESIAGEMVVDEGRGGPHGPRAEMGKQELRLVREVERHELPRLHAVLQEELRVAAGVCVRLAPCVASRPRPDCLGGLGLLVCLPLEEVPEAAAAVLACAAGALASACCIARQDIRGKGPGGANIQAASNSR